MRRTISRIAAVGILCIAGAWTNAEATCSPRSDQVYYAVDCAASSTTGGIQEAINACLQGYGTTSKGCTIMMPQGDVVITTGITIGGLTTSTAKSGIVLRGHGSGHKATDGSTDWNLGGTTLIWGGGANGTVLSLSGVSTSRFENFAIDGKNGTGSAAGRGIELIGCNSCSTPSQEDVFENISITDIVGSPGNAVDLHGAVLVNESPGIAGQKYDDQVSETVFEHLFINNSNTAFFEDSSQATDIHLVNCTFLDYQYGVKLQDGALITTNVDYEGSAGGTQHTTIADVYVSSSADEFTSFRDYHESPAGSCYVFDNLDRNGFRCGGSDSGNCRYSTTALYSSRVLALYDMCNGGGTSCATPAGYALLHKARGPLTVQGGNFFMGVSGYAPILASLDSSASEPDYGVLKTVSSGGNTFAYPSVVWKTHGNVSVMGTDVPLTRTTPLGSSGALEFWRSGIIFGGDSVGTLGSITWKDETNADRYKVYYNSTLLKFLDGANNTIMSLATPAVPLQFEGTSLDGVATSLAVTNPTAPRTVTLPDRSGTVVLSNDTLSGDVVGTFSAGGATTATIADGAVEPSDVDTTNGTGSAGQCPAKAAGDQFTWTDVVTPTGTATLTHKTLTDSTNVFAVSTVFSFTGAGPTTNGASTFMGPSNGLGAQASFGAAGAPVPALKVTTLLCRATTTPGSSKTWTVALQNGSSAASGIGTCVLSSTQNPCSVTGGSSSYALNDVLSLKITASTPAPAPAQVMCTALASN